MFSKKSLWLLCALLLTTKSVADEKKVDPKPKSDVKKSLTKDCANTYSATCLKLDLVSWVDKLNEDDNYSVLPGVSLVKESHGDKINTADIVADLARDFPNDPEARLDTFLMKKLASYLNSHSLRLNLFGRDSVESARGVGGIGGLGGLGGGGGGGGSGGGGGGMGPMLAAGAMMKGTLTALFIGGIALVAGKALMAGLMSLVISAIIGLKSLTHGHKEPTYEVISKPIYSHSSSHSIGHEDHHEHHPSYGHSAYGRSFVQPLPLGLRPDYKPA